MSYQTLFTSSPLAALLLALPLAATALENGAPEDISESLRKLKNLSLEQMLNEQVTTVARTPTKLAQAPAAIQVITGEEIQRSGVTSLPEALRLASNLQVGQVNSHDWAISARGFNNSVANKLLVMIDGRTIYTPLYAGVFWDVQSTLLEDIDHIEVVNGPGGTLWGANAVNGVINIITKSAKDTQGLYVSGAAGSLMQDFGAVRYGGGNGSNFFYRVYGQRFDRNSTRLPSGADAADEWDMTQGGFRTDWLPSEMNTLTVQGDFYGVNEEGIGSDTTADGQNVLGRWTHVLSDTSDLQVQLYFDRVWRDIPGQYAEDLKTYDLDFQHRFAWGERNKFVWGAGYRFMQDEVTSGSFMFTPEDRDLQLFSGFLQDELALVPERLFLTLGTKLEHNDYSGFEVQPSARLSWLLTERQTLWAAVSRAVRSPSRNERDLHFTANGIDYNGNAEFDSEKLLAYELGYRIQPMERLSLSSAFYYHQYEEIRSVDFQTATTTIFGNHYEGDIWGAELSGTYQLCQWWRLRAGYNYLNKDLDPTAPNAGLSVREGNDAENQFSFQSLMDLPGHFQWDVTGRYVDQLPSPVVPAYFSLEVRLAWSYEAWELAVVGQNLLDDQHPEFGTREIPRSVYGKVTLRF